MDDVFFLGINGSLTLLHDNGSNSQVAVIRQDFHAADLKGNGIQVLRHLAIDLPAGQLVTVRDLQLGECDIVALLACENSLDVHGLDLLIVDGVTAALFVGNVEMDDVFFLGINRSLFLEDGIQVDVCSHRLSEIERRQTIGSNLGSPALEFIFITCNVEVPILRRFCNRLSFWGFNSFCSSFDKTAILIQKSNDRNGSKFSPCSLHRLMERYRDLLFIHGIERQIANLLALFRAGIPVFAHQLFQMREGPVVVDRTADGVQVPCLDGLVRLRRSDCASSDNLGLTDLSPRIVVVETDPNLLDRLRLGRLCHSHGNVFCFRSRSSFGQISLDRHSVRKLIIASLQVVEGPGEIHFHFSFIRNHTRSVAADAGRVRVCHFICRIRITLHSDLVQQRNRLRTGGQNKIAFRIGIGNTTDIPGNHGRLGVCSHKCLRDHIFGDIRNLSGHRLFRRQRDRRFVFLGFQGRADLITSDLGHIICLGFSALTDSHFSADGGNGCLKGVRAIQHDPLMLILDRGSIQLICHVQRSGVKRGHRHGERHTMRLTLIDVIQGGIAVQGDLLIRSSLFLSRLDSDLILQGHFILQALVRVIPGNSGTGEIGFASTSCDCYSIFVPHQTNLSAHRIGDEAFEVFADLPQSQIQLGFIIRIELVRIVTRQFVKTVVSESKSNSIDFAAHTAFFLACLKFSEICQPFQT